MTASRTRARLDRVLSEATLRAFQEAIRVSHGCESSYVESVPVHEQFKGETVWEGIVHVFNLQGHRTASRAYAWAEPLDDLSARQMFHTVLNLPPVDSPLGAIRFFIISEVRKGRPGAS